MRWQKIPAILLILILLAGSFAFAEETQNTVTLPEVSRMQEQTDEQLNPVEQLRLQLNSAMEQQKLYYILVDCGYTLYGSTAFENSAVEIPGDPNGEVLSMLKDYIVDLIPADANIVVKGYHSDVVGKNAAVVSASELTMVRAQFDALLNESAGARQSSKLDAALAAELETIKGYAANYDCTVVLVTGGAMGYYSDAPDMAALNANLESIRTAGAKIAAFGLSGEDMLKDDYAPEQYLIAGSFKEGEYFTADIPEIKKNNGYAAARMDMMADLAEVLNAAAGATVDRFSAESNDEVLAKLEGVAANDTIYTFGWYTDEEKGDVIIRSRYVSDGLKKFLSENDISGLRGNAFVICKGKAFPDLAAREAAEAAKRQLIADMKAAMNEINVQLVTPLDTVNGAKSFELPANYDPERVTIKSDNEAVLSAVVENGQLVLTPNIIGSANVICEVKGAAQPMTAAVSIINSSIDWSWTDGAEYTLVGGAMKDASGVDAQLTASISDKVLYWTIQKLQGATVIDSVSGNTLTAEGEEPRSESGVNGAIAWTEETVPGCMSLQVSASAMGEYAVTCEVRDGENVLRSESRTFTVHAPIDAIASAELIYPYFAEQEGQNVVLTCGGAAVNAENYTVTVEPADALSVYTNEDGSGLYLVANKAGDATVTVTENGVDNPVPTVMNVTVKSLTSNPLLWVCGIGAVVCLMGLTAGVVILIGKCASKSTKERNRR